MIINISTDTNGHFRVETIVDLDNTDLVSICLSQDLVSKTMVMCQNSGIPGIVGPDVPFSITEVLDPILDKCTAAATYLAYCHKNECPDAIAKKD